MASLKDNLLVEKESLKLSLEQSSFSVVNFLRGFPRGKKRLLVVLGIGLIPLILLARFGSQWLVQRQLAQGVVTAHTAYVAPRDIEVDTVKVLRSGQSYSAFVQITNQNLDLSAPHIGYRFNFTNNSGQTVSEVSGSTFLLPDQKKYLVVPRVEATEQITSAKLTLEPVRWQKRLSLPEVSLRTATPFITNEVNPLTLVVEGAVVNSSAYELGSVRLVFLLYNQQNQIVAVSQRDEFNIPAFGRRAYTQTWPDLYVTDIARAVVTAETNLLEYDNLLPGSQ